jgi:protein-L-isoaspartate(D-aspartate) O-methyltransferase
MTYISNASVNEAAPRLRDTLVRMLIEDGALTSPQWISAFRAVPRHVFVPRFLIDRDSTGTYEFLDSEDPAMRQEWLERVYLDEPLPTQLDGDAWISSSSQPSLMAMMLEALDVTGGERILEIGTGTGYNAALLCEALSYERVVTVDIDPSLIRLAKQRLNGLGYFPTVEAVDGADGYADASPYDRIVATCSMTRVPASWIKQASEGGLILVNLYRDFRGGALALLSANEEEASGNFLPFAGGFMPTRTLSTVSGIDLLESRREENESKRPARIGGEVLQEPNFAMFAGLRISAQQLSVIPNDEPEQFWLLSRNGSWAQWPCVKSIFAG